MHRDKWKHSRPKPKRYSMGNLELSMPTFKIIKLITLFYTLRNFKKKSQLNPKPGDGENNKHHREMKQKIEKKMRELIKPKVGSFKRSREITNF